MNGRQRLTIDEVDETLAAAGLYRIGSYKNKDRKVLALCLSCQRCVTPRLGNLRQGWRGCKSCGTIAARKLQQLDINEIDAALENVGLERVGFYRGNKESLLCICLKCKRLVIPTMGSIKAGRGGCFDCGHLATANARRLTVAQVDQSLENINLIRIGAYVNSITPILCVCLECNNYASPAIGNVRRGSNGCVSCADSGFNPSMPGYFYVVANDKWLKCGITNFPPNRLLDHARQGLTSVLYSMRFESGRDARTVEKKWLAHVKTFPVSARATKSDIRDGYTETVRNLKTVQRWIDANLVI